ncbi:MAG: glycosyltransferase family 2 protein [Patescibacteria group bacterium]|nr:glycosyltransferase family 2 protein [Patescibacteria group bacterium]
MPLVYIIILNWNGLKDTEKCLESLKNINYNNYKIVLVDNGSKNNEDKILKQKFGNYIHIISNKKNLGFAEGNNIGIRYALRQNADYILCLNNDTVVRQNFLNRMVDSAVDNKADMVATRMLNYFDKNKIDNLGIQMTWSGLAFNILEENCKYLFCPCGGATLYSAKLLRSVSLNNNYFDPDFFMYNEDVDLGFRARLLGYNCVLADNAIVYHKGGASSGHLSNFHVFYNQRNILYVILKNFPISLLIWYSFWIILLQIGLFLIALKRRKAMVFLKADINLVKNFSRLLIKRKEIQSNRKVTIKKIKGLVTPKPFLMDYFLNSLKR